MGTAYFNREDIVKRLGGTICFYAGHPYYVDAGHYKEKLGNNVRLLTLENVVAGQVDTAQVVDYTSDLFNYKSPALGYMFYKKKEAVYVSRMPDRNQSQGLNPYTLHTQPQLDRYAGWYFTRDFQDALLGIYPSRSAAEALLAGRSATSVPISRNVALGHTRRGLIEIFYKGRPVACNLKGRGIELYDIKEQSYMKSLLAKDGIMVG